MALVETAGADAAPRNDLIRTATFELDRSATADDGLTFEGYAAVFDSPTVIDSWEGHFIEEMKRGAFTRTIAARTPILGFDHGKHPLIGSIPLGSFRKLAEDAKGLFVRARLMDNWLIQPVRDAIREGAIDGMSFRMHVKDDIWTTDQASGLPHRAVREVACPELGPVVYPAYLETTASVRSAEIDALARAIGVSPETLVEFRSLILSTSSTEHGSSTSEQEPAGITPGSPPAPGHTPEARARALTLLTLEVTP